MSQSQSWPCYECGNVGFEDGLDGFFYCSRCSAQSVDVIDTGVADEDFVNKGTNGGALYLASHTRHGNASAIEAEPISQSDPFTTTINSQFWSALTLDDNDARIPNQSRDKKEEERNNNVEHFDDSVGPTCLTDFGWVGKSAARGVDFSDEIRMKYVMGLQLMIELQCEALVRKFKVSPLICGLAGTVWLRFVASTRVFDDDWADGIILDSEKSQQEEPPSSIKLRKKHAGEVTNMYGKRAVMIWFRSLKKQIPLSYSLAVSFLVCHLAREAVLPTDIVKWSVEGKLPYFAAFVEIEKRIGKPSRACPMSSSFMFRPTESISLQKLESQAALIGNSIGLNLPPVNFYAIASRYLHNLSLPVQKILSHACHLFEWSMPPDLWLSMNELRLPTRVCVMSILIVAIRILYNIHGFGEWEKNLCTCGSTTNSTEEANSKMSYDKGKNSASSPQDVDGLATDDVESSPDAQESKLNTAELLDKLEKRYHEMDEIYDYSKDLPTYLQYCKDVVFAGLEPSFEDYEEEKLIDQLWDFYQNGKDSEMEIEDGVHYSSSPGQKRLRDDEEFTNSYSNERKKFRDKGCVSSSGDGTHQADDQLWSQNSNNSFNCSQGEHHSISNEQASGETHEDETEATGEDEAIRLLKLNMEENRFCYIPPRVNVKRFDYLHYVRKKDEGSYTYIAHADYYILLRACARAARVEIRCMHIGVLSLEKRLAWLEKRIEHCLHLTPPVISCEFCSDVVRGNPTDNSLDLSKLHEQLKTNDRSEKIRKATIFGACDMNINTNYYLKQKKREFRVITRELEYDICLEQKE